MDYQDLQNTLNQYAKEHPNEVSNKGANSETIKSQVQNTRFNDVLNANPYTDMPREQTFWDRVVNWFGFRSGYDKAQEQYAQASKEYQAQVAQNASEEQYNSPTEQANRMRQAGLNPDLSGVSGEPATEFDNQQASPDVSADTISLGSVVSTLFSAISGTTALLNDVNSLKRARIALEGQDFDFASQMMNHFESMLPYFLSPNPSEQGTTQYNFNDFFHSKRALNRFESFYSKALSSLKYPIESYKSYNEYLDSNKKFAEHVTSPLFGDSGYINDAFKQFNKLMLDEINASLRYNIKHSSYQSEVTDKLDANVEAQSIKDTQRKASNDFSMSQYQIDATRIYRNMIKNLSSRDDIGSQILGLILGAKVTGIY